MSVCHVCLPVTLLRTSHSSCSVWMRCRRLTCPLLSFLHPFYRPSLRFIRLLLPNYSFVFYVIFTHCVSTFIRAALSFPEIFKFQCFSLIVHTAYNFFINFLLSYFSHWQQNRKYYIANLITSLFRTNRSPCSFRTDFNHTYRFAFHTCKMQGICLLKIQDILGSRSKSCFQQSQIFVLTES